MDAWENFFADEGDIDRIPQREVYEFVADLEKHYSERPLRIWDMCCGAGRHTVALARIGHDVYASDGSARAIDLTCRWVEKAGLTATTSIADMTTCPFKDVSFHGVVSWDSLCHNTIDNIRKALEEVRTRLVPDGLFMANIMSMSSITGNHGAWREVAPYTFVHDDGHEVGIPHHFFDEERLRSLLKAWEIVVLAEQVVSYKETSHDTPRINPFSDSFWGFVAKRRA